MSQGLKKFRVYFGGSFSPPHIGHNEIIKHLSSLVECQNLHLVPTGKNPLKSESNDYLFLNEWMADLQNLLDEESYKKIILEKIELESSKSSFTYNTLKELKSHYAQSSWVMVLGSDLIETLPKWYQLENLLKELDALWVYRREGVEYDQKLLDQYAHLLNIQKISHEIPEISSTELREWIKNCTDAGRVELKNHLSPQVYRALEKVLS